MNLGLAAGGLVGSPEQIRAKVATLEAGGCTEIYYGPIGSVEAELEAMAKVLL